MNQSIEDAPFSVNRSALARGYLGNPSIHFHVYHVYDLELLVHLQKYQ